MNAVIDPNTAEGLRWLRWLDGECFPNDKPLRISDAVQWNLVTSKEEPEAFCGWRPILDSGIGFHARAGVLPAARGQGLQVFMLQIREDQMRRAGMSMAVTYTEADGVASMRSLLKAGYLPYTPTWRTVQSIVVSQDRWKQMVYWEKRL